MLVIKNLTNKTIVAENAKSAGSLIDKTLGMILKSNSKGLIFKTRFGVHTFFMKNPIDILILNSENQVVDIKENLLPNRFFIWNPRFNIVIELESGSVKKSKTKIGDRLDF